MARALLLLLCSTLLTALPASPTQTPSPTRVETPVQLPPDKSEWPLFRGDPLQTGVASSTLPDKLEIRWKLQLKKGIESTAAIVKDTVYVGCFDDHLYAIDLMTGKEKWKT